MSLNKKVLSLAVLGVLASGNALADLGDTPVYFAKEIDASSQDAVTLATSDQAALAWPVGFSFSGSERWVRLACSGNIQLDIGSGPTFDAGDDDDAGVTFGSFNGVGSNIVTFAVRPGSGAVPADGRIVINGDHAITSTDQNVNCVVALYDQPSQALIGGANGRIGTPISGDYIRFADSYELVNVTQYTTVADVEADPVFSIFDTADSDWAWSTTQAGVGELAFRVKPLDLPGDAAQSVPFNVDGEEITLQQLFSAETTITVRGATDAFENVWLAGYPGEMDDDAIEFEVGNSGFVDGLFQVEVDGETSIPQSRYTATLNADANDGYVVNDISNVVVGQIDRNGTQLQAPLVQRPGARYISRVVLTNTGSQPRAYAIGAQGEAGNDITLGSAATGTVPANGTIVLLVNDVLRSFTPGMNGRATLNVTVSAPNDEIQGLYQIVDVQEGGISNTVMVRPGTN